MDEWLSSSKKILIGAGMANKKLREDYFLPHNTYIEILYQFGVLGSGIIFFYFHQLYTLIKSDHIKRQMPARFLPLIMISIYGLSLGMFSTDMIVLQLTIAFLIAAGDLIQEGQMLPQ